MSRSEYFKSVGYDTEKFNAASQAKRDELSAEYNKRQSADYRSKHWEQPNVLAHIRLSDRTDADGNKVLFVEEVQSDWGQEGKKSGFRKAADNSMATEADIDVREVRNVYTGYAGYEAFPRGNNTISLGRGEDRALVVQEALTRLRESSMGDTPGVPVAPFVDKTDKWLNLALKRIITMAVDGGYDKVAFVNGEQSAERYDLSKKISEINYEPAGDGLYEIYAVDMDGKTVLDEDEVTLARIEELVGKEIASKIEAGQGDKTEGGYRDWRKLSGLDLKVGGEGMKTFYDQIVPNAVNALLKKTGGGAMEKVGIGKPAVTDSHSYDVGKRGVDFVVENEDGVVESYHPSRAEARAEAGRLNATPEVSPAGRLAQPGFTITDTMRERAVGGLPLFAKGQPRPPTGITKAEADDVVATLKELWANAPEVVVVQNMNDLDVPAAARKENDKQKSLGAKGEPEGFFYGGKVYIVAGALKTPGDVVRVLLHETLGHYGLRGTFGQGLTAILKQIVGLRRPDIIKKARDYGLVKKGADGKPSVDVKTATDQEVWSAMSERDRLYAAEEVLAVMAQSKPNIGFVKRAIAVIRAFLRKHVPGFAKLKMTDEDIIANFILPARAFVERGPGGGVRGGVAFSQSEDSQPLDVLSQADDLFAMPKSNGKTIAEIIQNHDPEITVKEVKVPGNETFYNLTMADGTTARITVRKSGPNSVYDSTADADNNSSFESGRPGENPEDVDPYAEDVWIDVSRLKAGQNGILAYSIASTFAHNTDRIFIGDPNGLSDEAMRRRAENMLSSALKFGTTRHLAPHPRQTAGGAGVPALKWVYGDDVGNIERLIDLNLKALDNANSNAKFTSYNLDTGAFTDTKLGTVLGRFELDATYKSSGRSAMESKAQAGWRTIARGAVFRAILGRGGAQGNGAGRAGASGSVLAELVRQREKLASPIKDERVFYSRSLGATELAGQVRDKLNETFTHPGKLSWWHKTVGSQYNLAERNPAYKKVFDAAQSFINDVSYYGTEAANMAPKMIPKLETLRDLTKTAISAADNKAVAAPVFEGTLSWARDEDGKPIRIEALETRYEGLTDDQKAQMLLRKNVVTEAQLKTWKASKLDVYTGAVRNRFESTFLKAGVRWTDAELKSIFKLTDDQVGLYKEFRAATDTSLDNMAKAQMLREAGKDVEHMQDMVMEAPSVDSAAMILREMLLDLAKDDPDRADMLADAAASVANALAKVNELKKQGYAPLSRFGRYTLDVVVDGRREYFDMFESQAEANKLAAKMRAEFGAENVAQGTMSQKEFELFQGITPESLELFGNMMGLASTGSEAQDKAFQTYLKLAKNNRSAMKRMIHRQGIAGYSEDVGRVLAAFVYANARQTSAALHIGQMDEAINAIPKGEGELKDHALELAGYIKQPREEAAALRGLLFAQYLGGSVASAMVNFTQPLTVSIPYLSQFGGLAVAGKAWAKAVKDMSQGVALEAGLARALRDAEESGVVSPQEVHQLMAQARGSSTLQSGDGTRQGDTAAMLKNGWTRTTLAWGKLFGYAEQVNRRSTFIAAYRMAVDQKIANPGAFATKAVNETQFINNKANKMKFGRGAIGATLMTFKSYSLNWLELMHRMSTQGGPEGKLAAAYMLGALLLVAGAGGLPFAEDIEDLIDAVGQKMGYNVSTKKAKQEFLEDVFGKAGAKFMERGLTGIPGVPIDIAGRMGMQNLLPGTGLFLEKRDSTRDATEILGPVGDLTKRMFQAVGELTSGEVGKAVELASPRAVANAFKGVDMMDTGMYRDMKGAKVIDTTTGEAMAKMIGFQPSSVSQVQESNYLNQRAKDFYSLRTQEIRAKWATGIFLGEPDQVQEARDMMAKWNEKNPDQRMTANMPAIVKKVREMRKDKAQRIADTAPKAMRAKMQADARELAAQ